MDALLPYTAPDGVVFDGFLESTFCWKRCEHESDGVLPYREPWLGVIHNPPGIPEWHEADSAPQALFALPCWQASLPACRGLFTFSPTMADWLAARVPVPAEALIHPTETSERHFDYERFLEKPRIVQVGSWLRRMSSIALLPAARLRKACLVCRPGGAAHLEELVARENAHLPETRGADWSTVEVIEYLEPAAFDELLSASVVFLDLYDTVVNNTVVECIVRGTPVVCNRLPALVELLGADYPLFFDTLGEAAAKAEDASLVLRAARHLQAMPKHVFTGEYFAASLMDSAICRNLRGSR